MTDRDVRREVADEIASVLETKADECAARGIGQSGGEMMATLARADGFRRAAEIATKIGRRESA